MAIDASIYSQQQLPQYGNALTAFMQARQNRRLQDEADMRKQAFDREQAILDNRQNALRQFTTPASPAEHEFSESPSVNALSNILLPQDQGNVVSGFTPSRSGLDAVIPQVQQTKAATPASFDYEGAINQLTSQGDLEGASKLFDQMKAAMPESAKWTGVVQEALDASGKPAYFGITSSGPQQIQGFTPQPKVPEAPKTRTRTIGNREVTEEWNPSAGRWRYVSEAPRVAENPAKDRKDKMAQEMQLRKEFNALNSNYREVSRQKNIIGQSLGQNSAAGDLAAATSIMKMLDPGSVVRESELGMAMNATGAIDRIGNYAQMLSNGQRLNPEQRREFQSLANSLFSAADEAYRLSGDEYTALANEYGLSLENIVGRRTSAPVESKSPTPASPLSAKDVSATIAAAQKAAAAGGDKAKINQRLRDAGIKFQVK